MEVGIDGEGLLLAARAFVECGVVGEDMKRRPRSDLYFVVWLDGLGYKKQE